MKRASIKYSNTMDGKIIINEICNVASMAEIASVHGDEASRVYNGGVPNFYRHTPNYYYIATDAGETSIVVGKVFERMEFGAIIETMKKAGSRLSEIIRYRSEVKEVFI